MPTKSVWHSTGRWSGYYETVEDYGNQYNPTRKDGGIVDITEGGTQNWFEHLDMLSKARLAREWEKFIKQNPNVSVENLPWIWSSNAQIKDSEEHEEEEIIKSYMMISSDSKDNKFKDFNL